MRRSSSISRIPTAKNDNRPRSNSAARPSIKDGPSGSRGRPPSMERSSASTLKRSVSSSSLNYKRSISATPTLASSSKSYGAVKKSFLTPTMSSGFKRSISNITPSSIRSRSRSPYKLAFEKTANDKEWIFKQTAKVKTFLQQHSDQISTILKVPITINTFIYVMGILFKELDVRTTEMNNSNYKEVVMNTLKILHYPGNVTNSLLKTVNAKHAWPQVVCIFSWLVDLILVTKRVDEPVSEHLAEDIRFKKAECVMGYIIKRYDLYNNGEEQEIADQEFEENFGKVLNINEGEFEKLQHDVNSLEQLKEKQLVQISEQKEKNNNLMKEIDFFKTEIDGFYLNKDGRKDSIDDEIASLKARRDKLSERIQRKRENVSNLTGIIKNQSCTVKEKKQMMKKIEEMKHTIDLKREKIRTQKDLKHEVEVKLVEARKKVEIEVFKLNSRLMALILLEPELKVLELKETDYISEKFGIEIQNLVKNLKIFKTKFAKELISSKSVISLTNSKISEVQKNIQTVKQNVKELDDLAISIVFKIETAEQEMEKMQKKRDEDRKIFVQNLQNLKKMESRLQELNENLLQTQKMKKEKQEAFEQVQLRALEFFTKLHEIITNNVEEMNNMRTRIVDLAVKRLNEIKEAQEKICQELDQLEESDDTK